MINCKKVLSFILVFALLVSGVSYAFPMAALAAEGEVTGTAGYLGETKEDIGNSTTGLTYKSTFRENWEYGLDLTKWSVERLSDNFVSDFQVVDDPLGNVNVLTGEKNKVLTWTRYSTWLVPTDNYWPTNGLTAGAIKTIKFRMYMDNPIADVVSYTRKLEPGIICRYISPYEQDGWMFACQSSTLGLGKGLTTAACCWNTNYNNGQFGPNDWFKQGYVEGFDTSDWFDVTITYSGASMSFSAVDGHGNVMTISGKTPLDRGRYAIGNQLTDWGKTSNPSAATWNKQRTDGVTYIDDIEVTFTKSLVDEDDVQKDVNVYYAGNTFLNPGDTLDLTGESLGSVVINAQIKKIDTVVTEDTNNAFYVNETSYEHAPDSNVKWESIPYEEGSLITDLKIEQRSTAGIKMIIPDGSVSGQEMYASPGSYAVLLESAAADGKDAVVIVNNPQISMLLHDDGDYATPNGWLKLSGYNLSVQDNASKVSAIIVDKNGKRTWIDRSKIEVDTTENNGCANDYYMMVHLENLAPGEYQILVHNGYGGNYGWSMPYDFTVKEKAANTIWREKGVFNVQDYGAKGTSGVNDTAAIMSAINAAEQNGGGIIYFPAKKDGTAAAYRVTHPLIVGDNISFVGDGVELSTLYYYGMLQDKRQEYFISFEGNFEIDSMYIACQTNPFQDFLKRSTAKDAKAGKLYIKDSYLMNDAKGVTSNGRGTNMEGYTDAAAQIYVEQQWEGVRVSFYKQNAFEDTYLAITGSDVNMVYGAGSPQHLFTYTKYCYFDGLDLHLGGKSWSSLRNMEAGFFENGNVKALSGHMSYRNIASKNDTTNNRELFLCDQKIDGGVGFHVEPLLNKNLDYEVLLETELEALKKQGDKDKLMQEVKSFVDSCQAEGKSVYRFLDYTPKTTGWIIITYGQGAGQIRKLESWKKIGNYYYFTIDEAFAITPNRSSLLSLDTDPVLKSFINNGYFEDGGFVGIYGAGFDVVFDNITIKKCTSGVGWCTSYNGLIWYMTAKRVEASEINHLHTDYGNAGEVGGMDTKEMPEHGNLFLGMRYCDSYVGEGGQLQIVEPKAYKTVMASEVVYENIKFVSENPGMIVQSSATSEGIWLKEIVQYTEEGSTNGKYSQISPYDSSSITKIKAGVAKGTIWCDGVDVDYTRKLGDINGDGMITLKDMTLLFYLLGESVSADELNSLYGKDTVAKYADITADGFVDARDFLYLRAYILEDQQAMDAIGSNQSGQEPDTPVKPDVPDVPDMPDAIVTTGKVQIDFSEVEEED